MFDRITKKWIRKGEGRHTPVCKKPYRPPLRTQGVLWCPHSRNCSDYGASCETCGYNKYNAQKLSYYKPQ